MRKKKKFTKESFKLLIMKSQKFHGDSVKNESARAKKLEGARLYRLRAGGYFTCPYGRIIGR